MRYERHILDPFTFRSKYIKAHCLFEFVIVAMIASQLSAAPNSNETNSPNENSKRPTAALIDVDTSPLGILVQNELLKNESVNWLERNEIGKIIREQELASLFGPGTGRTRIQLGRLLKADLLVLIRRDQQNDVETINLVVCETKLGLRLCHEVVPRSKKIEADVEVVVRHINQGLTKASEQLTTIVAVPPFLNKDLTFEYDYLKSAYARLVEQQFLNQKGVLVVEFAEARAIAKEISLTGQASPIQRSLPLFLLGEFKNHGKALNRRTDLALTMKRGDEIVSTSQNRAIRPSDVPTVLRKEVFQWIKQHAGTNVQQPEPAREVKQMGLRAESFIQLGNWQEALSLVEAALLIQPKSKKLHETAMDLAAKISRDYSEIVSGESQLENATKGLNYYDLALTHYQQFLLATDVITDQERITLVRFCRLIYSIEFKAKRLPEAKERCLDAIRRRQNITFRFFERCVGTRQLTLNNFWIVGHSTIRTLNALESSPNEQFAVRLRLIQAIKGQTYALGWARSLGRSIGGIMDNTEFLRHKSAYLKFVDEIARIPDKRIELAAAELRKEAETRERSILKRAKGPRPTVPQPIEPNPDIEFHRITPKVTDRTNPSPRIFPFFPIQWFNANNATDVVWTKYGVGIMKQKGDLQIVERLRGTFHPEVDYAVCHDGKYVWVAKTKDGDDHLSLIDMKTYEIIRFTSADGLPPLEDHVAITPISPGRVCVAGSFSRGSRIQGLRGWCAIVTFDNEKGKVVDVIHEGTLYRELYDNDKQDLLNPKIAYHPRLIKIIRDMEDPKRVRILLVRSTASIQSRKHPLLIDPDQRTVEVVKWQSNHSFFPQQIVEFRGDLYWCLSKILPDKSADGIAWLWKLGFPSLKPTVVDRTMQRGSVTPIFMPDGSVLFYPELSGAWLYGKKLGDQYRPLKFNLPKTHERRFFHSNFYGLVMIAKEGAWQVSLPEQKSLESK